MYVYIFKLFIPPVKQKKVYIYKHFKELKSKKKPKFKKKITSTTKHISLISKTQKNISNFYISKRKNIK